MTDRVEKLVKIADRMYQARAAAKAIWGEKYAGQVAPIRQKLQEMVTVTGKPLMELVLEVVQSAEKRHDHGAAMLFLAAAVDLCEQGCPDE